MIDFGDEAKECDTGGGNEEGCDILIGVLEDVDIERDHSGHGRTLYKMQADGKLEVVAYSFE